jgi:hypothetical protein
MRVTNLLRLSAAAGLVLLAACSKDTTSPSLIDQTTLTTDVASSAGDAIANDVQGLNLAEAGGGLAAPIMRAPASVTGDSLSWTFTKTCFDSTGAGTACGTAAVRKIATHWTFTGFRDDTAENGAVFTGDVARSAYDTLTRNFTGGTEVSRTHDGNSAGSDTSSFIGPNVTRTYEEAGTDSVDAVVFNVPRSQFLYPASGTVIRNVTAMATFKNATESQTTNITKRVEVDFNGTIVATLKIDGKTCDLNLHTHHVSNCQ